MTGPLGHLFHGLLVCRYTVSALPCDRGWADIQGKTIIALGEKVAKKYLKKHDSEDLRKILPLKLAKRFANMYMHF